MYIYICTQKASERERERERETSFCVYLCVLSVTVFEASVFAMHDSMHIQTCMHTYMDTCILVIDGRTMQHCRKKATYIQEILTGMRHGQNNGGQMSVPIHIYIYIYMYIYTHTLHIYIYIYICMYVYMHKYIHAL